MTMVFQFTYSNVPLWHTPAGKVSTPQEPCHGRRAATPVIGPAPAFAVPNDDLSDPD
jgi:hypothetical protein